MNTASLTAKTLVLALLTLPAVAQQQQQPPTKKQQRDIGIEGEGPREKAPAVPAAPAIPRSYALVIGIANYKNLPPAAQLKFPERDVKAIYSILISQEGGNFPAENVRMLVGPDATLAKMKDALENWLPSVSKEQDRVLIYFAGHGFVSNGRAYLAPYDIDGKNIAGTGYPMDSLGQAIGSRIKAKWKVLLTDSCHSGAISPDTDVQAINRKLLDLDRSLFSLTASRDRERSFESPEWGGGHGIFTYYVVKGLEGAADESRDAIVTADELAEYVRRNVREATGGQQNPTSERASFDPNMLLAYVPSLGVPPQPGAPKFGVLVIESNMDGVEVFVDGTSVGVVNKGQPLRLPGLQPGRHAIKGVRMGYEPDGPREEMVYPGQTSTITLRIQIPRRRPKAALDLLDRGLEYYNKGNADNYRKAAAAFQKALDADPTYSQAALYLARAQRDLTDFENAEKNFKRAIEIDPDYIEARASYAGMLLDTGNLDEAIRQLNVVVNRDAKHPVAWYLLAQCYRMKDAYPQAVDAGRKAIQINPSNGDAHFWLAEGLRMSGDYAGAIAQYNEYLRLSDYDSKLAGQLNYYVLGYLAGIGKKKRASQQDVWADLRSLAYFGLCDSERLRKNVAGAIAYCQRSLTYDRADANTHYALGLLYMHDAKSSGRVEGLPAARKHFCTMLELNPELADAGNARRNVTAIDKFLDLPAPNGPCTGL